MKAQFAVIDLHKDIIKSQKRKINLLERKLKIKCYDDIYYLKLLTKIDKLSDKQMEKVFLIIQTVASLQHGSSKDIYSILDKCYEELESLNS